MTKFVGLVNGKLYNNEKDFSKAALDAINAKDGLLSISSYYTSDSTDNGVKTEVENPETSTPETLDAPASTKSTQVERTEKDETKVEPQNVVPEKDYVIVDGEDKDYEITLGLYNKLTSATNKNEIRKVVTKVKEDIDADIKKTNDSAKDIQIKIDNLNEDLYCAENKIDELYNRKRYYNHILDIVGSNQHGRPVKKRSDSFWDILDIYNFLR
jgi:hypothetical protein